MSLCQGHFVAYRQYATVLLAVYAAAATAQVTLSESLYAGWACMQ